VLGRAGIVMFGMVAAIGIRIRFGVDYQSSRNNLYVVEISIGFGMIPLVAPHRTQSRPFGRSAHACVIFLFRSLSISPFALRVLIASFKRSTRDRLPFLTATPKGFSSNRPPISMMSYRSRWRARQRRSYCTCIAFECGERAARIPAGISRRDWKST
jgi:hypothetical protein